MLVPRCLHFTKSFLKSIFIPKIYKGPPTRMRQNAILLHFCYSALLSPLLRPVAASAGSDAYDPDIVYPRLRYSPPPCEVDGFLAPIKYQPTVMLQKNTILKAPLDSACMKCGICMVVSEKLDQILHFALKSSVSLEDFDAELSSQLLRPICDYAFHSYELKEWEGHRFISQYPFLDNVPNSLEGHWSEVLQAACHSYLNHFGDDNLVKTWLYESRVNITSLICRNDGIFRDCLNIQEGVLTIQFPSRFLFPANYVQINYACA